MSERLTREDIDDLHMVSKRDSMKRWRLAIEELRDRRAADLSALEEIVLQSHLTRIADDPLVDRAVVRLLDRILNRGDK